MRRIGAIGAAAFLAVGITACTQGGGISLPTNIPATIPTSITITLPTQTTQTTTPTQTQSSITTIPRTETTVTRTETVTHTETPSRTTTTTTPAVAPASETTGIPTWLWIVLALLLLLLIALIVWLVRRAQARAAWDERLEKSRQHAIWVEDSLVPQVMSRAATAEAAATWRAAGPRLLNVDEELHDLGSTAPDPERAQAANNLRSRLAGLVQAVGADTATDTDARVDDLRARRAAIQRARTDLRNEITAGATRRR